MVQKIGIQGLYYIVHFDNIISILEKGILSHEIIEIEGLNNTPIYNSQIVDIRSRRIVSDNKSLWSFANLYFQPRNAMLYSVINKTAVHQVAIICIKKKILDKKNIFITTGNAASQDSQIIPIEESEKLLPQIRKEINKTWWNNEDGSKRKMMAECLVPEPIVPSYIQMIYVACDRAREDLGKKLLACDKPSFSEIPITVEPERFFQPVWSARLTSTVSLIRGDMFFSKMQTLTVSVNCVGVMGKGLASTAKDRFPDVYVRYEKVCRNKSLQIGKPYLYKRESSVIEQLAEPTLLPSENLNDNSQTWFLLFPTKNHWKNNSTLIDIENGLQWLCENYKSEGIKSLAMPALGCGLGGLEWRDVGPLMCKYLTSIDIPVAIYLPSEGKLSDDLVSRDFLLSQV